jgi:hypothetical protein
VLEFDAKKIHFLHRLRIEPASPDHFTLELLNEYQVLLSIRADFDLTLVRNETKQFRVLFCEQTECVKLVDFEFNFLQDVIASLGSVCSFGIAKAQNLH